MNEKKFIIELTPVAQPRPKVTRFGTFDPAKDKKNWAKTLLLQQLEEKDEILECPIEMEALFYLPIPKSESKKKQALMLSNEIKHQKAKDIDNLLKFLFDIMNGLVFKDDKQIWKISAQKLYSHKPRTEVLIKW